MTYQIGQTFTTTTTIYGKTCVETAEIVRLTGHRVVYAWTVNGKLVNELSIGFKQFARKFGTLLEECKAEFEDEDYGDEPSDTDGDTSHWNENGEGSEADNDRWASRNWRD